MPAKYNPNYNLIVAMCKNNGIGYKGHIPWHIKADLQYFSKLTKGPLKPGKNAVVMGVNTWKSLPQGEMGLRGRDNLVLSTKSQSFDKYLEEDRLIKTFTSVELLDNFIANSVKYDDVWIIGGSQIYNEYLSSDKIQKCYITYIDCEFECDTFFPPLDMTKWTEQERRNEYNADYNCSVSYIVYKSK